MIKWRKFSRNQSIRNRLIKWFLIIALVPMAWATLFSYFMAKDILFNQASRHLQTLVSRQTKLLEYYFYEKKLEANEFLRNPTVIDATQTLEKLLNQSGKDSFEYQKAKLSFYPFLASRAKALNYQNLWLVTTDGIVVFSLTSSFPVGQNIIQSGSYTYLEGIVEKSVKTLKMQMTSLILNENKDFFNSFMAIPLLSPNDDQLIGIVIVEFNNDAMHQLFSDFNELAIANLLIATKLGDRFFVVDPSINQTSRAIDPTTDFGKVIQTALSQSHAKANGIKWNHRKYLMVAKRFPNHTNLVFITQVSEAKLLNPIYELGYLVIPLAVIPAVLVIFAASHVAKKIASPILLLIKKTQTLAEGDLSQRIYIDSEDEIGKLGQSFNTMAFKLNQLIKTQQTLFKLEKELAIASDIQQSIIPHHFHPFPEQHSFEIYGKMIPVTQVGGDFFDFFPLEGNRLGFLIGDVSGKGVPAAFFMAMSRVIIRATAFKANSPKECLEEANRLLCLDNEACMFVTTFYGIYHLDTGLIECANAGHNPPILLKSDGSQTMIARYYGIPLGIFPTYSYINHQFTLHKGDCLILYTDGMIEARNPQQDDYGEKRFAQAISDWTPDSLPTLTKHLLDRLSQFTQNAPPFDDVALLCIRQLE